MTAVIWCCVFNLT